MLWPVSDHSKPILLVKQTNWSNSLLIQRLSAAYPMHCTVGNSGTSKIRLLPSIPLELCAKLLDLEKFSHARWPSQLGQCCELSSTDKGRQFITLSVHFCVQRDGRHAPRRADSSATFNTSTRYAQVPLLRFVVNLLYNLCVQQIKLCNKSEACRTNTRQIEAVELEHYGSFKPDELRSVAVPCGARRNMPQ